MAPATPAAPPPPPDYPNPASPQNWNPSAPGWSQGPPAYRGPMLPPWLTFGAILILVGGVLIFAGFLVDLIGTAAYVGSTTASASNYAASIETYDALVGVGILVAVLGWIFHQAGVHRRMGH